MSLLDTYNVKPMYKVYEFTNMELESIFRDMMENATGIEQHGLFIDYDEETQSIYVIFNDDWIENLTEKDWEQFDENLPIGMHPDEWHDNARILFHHLFGKEVLAYADVDSRDENAFKWSFTIKVELPYA